MWDYSVNELSSTIIFLFFQSFKYPFKQHKHKHVDFKAGVPVFSNIEDNLVLL